MCLMNLVLAVAIGAQRRLRDAARQRLPVHAGPILLRHFAVAHAAGVRHGGAEGLRFGRQQFVRAAVAEGAIGRALIPALARLAVHAEGVIARLVLVASGAHGLGNARGVRILLVGFVTGIARQPRVRALRQFLPLVVAGEHGPPVAFAAASGWAGRARRRPIHAEPRRRPVEESARFNIALQSRDPDPTLYKAAAPSRRPKTTAVTVRIFIHLSICASFLATATCSAAVPACAAPRCNAGSSCTATDRRQKATTTRPQSRSTRVPGKDVNQVHKLPPSKVYISNLKLKRFREARVFVGQAVSPAKPRPIEFCNVLIRKSGAVGILAQNWNRRWGIFHPKQRRRGISPPAMPPP